ncbi:MAG: DUF1080 domain-containing protein [Fimbriiglobus sp.]|jgi:hypothetical protein|nr:DUF1080 domain-containing protein [Fimbriiglobus sp.]
MRHLLPLLALAAPAFAADPPKSNNDGFVPLFNGKDLTGFVNVNCGPKTWTVKDGVLVTSGFPIGLLRTEKQYENFECEFEWKHINTKEVGNSGFFVWCDPLPQVGGPFTRGIEVQVLVNYPKNDWATNHGDVFSVSGAKCTPDRPHPTRKGLERCLPSEERCKGGGEWNHYRVVANNGAIKLSVNGKEVSGVSECSPRKGYLSFESEGAECHFRNVKIKELPTSNPKPEQVASVDEGWKPLFNHTDLTGWKTDAGAWKVADGVLRSVGKAELTADGVPERYELIFDWKGPAEVRLGSGGSLLKANKPGQWQRERVKVEGPGQLTFPAGEKLELRNVYVRELTKK